MQEGRERGARSGAAGPSAAAHGLGRWGAVEKSRSLGSTHAASDFGEDPFYPNVNDSERM
jgi:hypothetical protein